MIRKLASLASIIAVVAIISGVSTADDKKENNVVLNVFEKGYRYHDKVIRHAKVIVNKK